MTKDDINYTMTDNEKELIKEALIHTEHKVPNIDREWKLFSTRINQEGNGFERKTSFKKIIFIAAAGLLLFLLIKLPFSNSSPNKIREIVVNNISADERGNDTKNIKYDSTPFNENNIRYGEIKKIMTTSGEDKSFVLEDGTHVWLNAESQIQYPEKFGDNVREVYIHGEAYFDVARDTRRPFIVRNNCFSTTVLGTSFNIVAYPEKEFKLTLVKGKVALQCNNERRSHIVLPGQEIVATPDSIRSIRNINTYSLTQRKLGYFYFENATLREIMTELGNWYGRTIVFENKKEMDIEYHFIASRHDSLEQIINRLCELDGLDIDVGDKDIIIR